MKKFPQKERINHSKKQLSEFLKLPKEERLEYYFKLLRPAIARLYDIVFVKCSSDIEYSEFERLKTDNLLLDIELIPYYSDSKHTISYSYYRNSINLDYPSSDYEIIDEQCGMCKEITSGKILFFPRIAIDYTLETVAMTWHEQIPKILELFNENS